MSFLDIKETNVMFKIKNTNLNCKLYSISLFSCQLPYNNRQFVENHCDVRISCPEASIIFWHPRP
jgi:hypothetical protein